LVVIAVALISAAISSYADTFNYSVTFDSFGSAHGVVSGQFDGTQSGNIITDLSNATVLINGVSVGPNLFIRSVSNEGLDVPVVSFDPALNNFVFSLYDTASPVFAFGDGLVGSANLFVSYSNELRFSARQDVRLGDPSWSLVDVSTSSVPDCGMTINMLIMAVAGLAGFRRKLR
jgi:hypothetical protein